MKQEQITGAALLNEPTKNVTETEMAPEEPATYLKLTSAQVGGVQSDEVAGLLNT